MKRTSPRLRKSPAGRFRPGRHRAGLTLAEIAVAAVLVGVMMVATLDGAGAVFRSRHVARQRVGGDRLAWDLMQEIMQAAYEDPVTSGNFGLESGESGGTRAAWDDVDDYDGYTDSPPEDRAGEAIPDASGWSRSVSVARADVSDPIADEVSESGLKRITVTVTSPTGEQFSFSTLRARAGLLEFRGPLDDTLVTGIHGRLRLGEGGQTVIDAATMVNHAKDN